jgi:hypothetical protein
MNRGILNHVLCTFVNASGNSAGRLKRLLGILLRLAYLRARSVNSHAVQVCMSCGVGRMESRLELAVVQSQPRRPAR